MLADLSDRVHCFRERKSDSTSAIAGRSFLGSAVLVRTDCCKGRPRMPISATLIRLADQGSAPDEKSFHDVASKRDASKLGDVFEVKKEIPAKIRSVTFCEPPTIASLEQT